ncbi:MAG: peptidoglycan -binding protein [Alphaproteobacteria bacterium]|nr:peptidoglycan -binding protein [Alphaproteobacteria bacterium]
MASSGRRFRRTPDIWPGFVDALATLVMVITFLLLVFVLAQFFLGQALSGRDVALSRLNRQIGELAELLALERSTNSELRANIAQLSGELQSSVADRERLSGRMKDTDDVLAAVGADREALKSKLREADLLRHDIAALKALRAEMEAKVAELGAKLGEKEGQIAQERKLSEEARAHAALLNAQLEALKLEIQRLVAALDASEALAKEQKVQIADLGGRLNQALASKVEELKRYRSEFFGRLREVLGSQPGIRVEGDRFVFQSELLFGTGSAEVGEAGQAQLAQLSRTLLDISKQIPTDLAWVLRVDGHTDRVPIATARFASNWELSTARATSVVKFLIAQGIPPERLAAAGFGEFQPLDHNPGEEALARNRRIELRLDQR